MLSWKGFLFLLSHQRRRTSPVLTWSWLIYIQPLSNSLACFFNHPLHILLLNLFLDFQLNLSVVIVNSSELMYSTG